MNSVVERSRRFPAHLAARDLVWLGWTAAAWTGQGIAPAGTLAEFLSMVAGVSAAICGFLVHGWGHWLGARVSGSRIHLPKTWKTVFLFRFDAEANTRPQFLAMSMGGFASTGLVAAGFFHLLTWGNLAGATALGLTSLGIAATIVLEVPGFLRAVLGAPVPRDRVVLPGEERD